MKLRGLEGKPLKHQAPSIFYGNQRIRNTTDECLPQLPFDACFNGGTPKIPMPISSSDRQLCPRIALGPTFICQGYPIPKAHCLSVPLLMPQIWCRYQ